ncbi:MAG TPA: aldo/keto reductase [Candidatus Salinicoccus stercoripullorum]|uniref:Aldo/keto reductase n=1 Tax=Candidatus Salinicoccus stercoripullorum TaxID=2838756 RepID=A0A9D1QGN7_9STAP|nr:aldo/keto reductase [Candidatus Salinicoccus stercoripullorum]
MKILNTKDGLSLSELSLGCMNLPIDDKAEAEKIIEAALDAGINYFDTADLYQFGENEKMVGEILDKYRSRYDFLIGTKVGNQFDAAKQEKTAWNPTAPYIKEAVKDSLHRLGVNELDLYQLHGGTIEDNKDETIQAFEDLKQEGTIRSYGISSVRMNVIDYYKKHSAIATLMMQFNPIDNRPLEVTDELSGIRPLARGPLMKGLLSANAASVLEKKFDEGVLGYSKDELKATVDALAVINRDLTALSYAFLRKNGAVIVNGVSSLRQLEDNLRSYRHTEDLTDDGYNGILEAVKILKYGEHRI